MRRKLGKWGVSPGGGHYHSRTEGGVLPAEAAFGCAGSRAPRHSPTPEQVLGAGRPLLAAVRRLPLSLGWSIPSPALGALEGGWRTEGQGRVWEDASSDSGSCAKLRFLPAESGALSPGQPTAEVPRSVSGGPAPIPA